MAMHFTERDNVMKKKLSTILLAALLLAGCSHKKPPMDHDRYMMLADEVESAINSGVWISTSPKARAYHTYEDCEYLNKTTYDIKEVDVEFATNHRRHLCHYCAERMNDE